MKPDERKQREFARRNRHIASCWAAREGATIDDAMARDLVRAGLAHPRQPGVRRLALTDAGRDLAARYEDTKGFGT